MEPLQWYAESFSPVGNITSEGAQRQLGRYNLDPLAVLVRESVQNSWDAHLPGHTPHYSLRGWRLTETQHATLRSMALPGNPPGLGLDRLDVGTSITALAISDRGTCGLLGPVRADQVKPDSMEQDFVDFMLNMGQTRNTDFGGGTYGYGKSILYRLSKVNTILVHTHTTHGGKSVQRFMAAALGNQFEGHTGRHWWGRLADDGFPEPLEGHAADQMAAKLGMPQFSESESGTTIMILDPDLGSDEDSGDDEDSAERSLEEALAYISATILWNFWPKMIPDCPEDSRMTFSVELSDVPLPLPSPSDHRLFRPFIKAMRDVERARLDDSHRPMEPNRLVQEIACQRPALSLGLLGLRREPEQITLSGLSARVSSHEERIENQVRLLSPSANTSLHHVALMRDARLLVHYEEGPASEEDQYAGVFLAHHDKKVDDAFAESEPPTHDNWEPTGMGRPEGTYVRVAMRRIKECINRFALPERNSYEPGATAALGRFSSHLAGLVSGIASQDPAIQPNSSSAHKRNRKSEKARKKRANVKLVSDQAQLEAHDGKRVARLQFRIEAPPEMPTVHIKALVATSVMDGSAIEEEPPTEAEQPMILRWEGDNGSKFDGGSTIELPANPKTIWSILVSVPADAAVSIDLSAEEPE